MTSKDPETINNNQKYIFDKNILFSAHLKRKQDRFENSHIGGHSRPPGGGLQEAPRAIFCKNKTII